jgi:hypothetical protein
MGYDFAYFTDRRLKSLRLGSWMSHNDDGTVCEFCLNDWRALNG